MNIIFQIAMFGWVPLLIVIFSLLPTRLAVATGVIGGTLFLPMGGYLLGSGLPNWDKLTLSSVMVLIVSIMFDGRSLLAFRPKWYDLFAVLIPLQGAVSSLLVGNGIASFQTFTDETVRWLAPYLLGRLYFTDLKAMRTLAIAVALGGIAYAPFCLWEIRMSPVLHTQVYGFHQHSWMQSLRGGGWRPVVFMQHGLMVGLWMCATTATLFWLWTCGVLRSWKVPAGLLVLAMLATSVLCKSTGAIVTMVLLLLGLACAKWFRWRMVLLVLALLPLVYEFLRGSNLWDGQNMVQVSRLIAEDRASSLETRLRAETMFVDRALQRPFFGWGGWGRYRVDEQGQNLATPDGLWLFMFGKYGLIGLAAMNAVLLLPVLRLVRNYPARTWASAEVAPAVAMGAIVTMYALDNLFNAMINPVYVVAAGALLSLPKPSLARAAVRTRMNPLVVAAPPMARALAGPAAETEAGRQ